MIFASTNFNYRCAVIWIAVKDQPTCLDVESIVLQTTVNMVSEIYDVHPLHVARDVRNYRVMELDANEKTAVGA